MTFFTALGQDFSFTRESLQATLLASLLSVWTLAGVFSYLNRYTKRSYFTLWTVAWLFYAMWLTLSLGLLQGGSLEWIRAWQQGSVGVTAAFLFWGTLRFAGARVRPRTMGLVLVFLLCWSVLGARELGDRRVFEWPFFGLVGVVGLATAGSFYRYRRRHRFIGAGLLMFGFGLWAVHMAAVPVFYASDDLATCGFLLAAVLQLFIAVSMIILVLEETRASNRLALAQVAALKHERKSMTARVNSTEERCRSLFDQASEAIVIASAADLRILDLNKPAERLLGVARDAATLRTFASFLHVSAGSRELPRAGEDWREWIAARREIHLAGGSSGLLAVEVDSAPVEFGAKPAFQFFMREVTDRLKLEQQLRQSEKLSSLGRMISGVAHELNNPLTVIKGYLDLVVANHAISEGTRKDLEKVSRECDRATKLVKNFLAFARDAPVRREPVRLNELIQRLADLRKIELLLGRVDFEVELDPDLPLVHADADQLHQVLANLITNAIQVLVDLDPALPRRIRVETGVVGGMVRVAIEDTGPGVPRELENRIFEPFFTTKMVGTGTGLGLSIAHRILTDHGGRIYHKRSPLGGAGFYLEIPPAAADQREPVASSPPAVVLSSARPASVGIRILVLDDERQIAEMLAEMLTMLGHEPRACVAPAQALEVLEEESFDLILSDFRMPGMNGAEFYARVREMDASLASRIIFLTGDVVNEETGAFLAATGNAHLGKPFQIAALAAVIEESAARALK
jgi:two-component system NtrC family sensor kinase